MTGGLSEEPHLPPRLEFLAKQVEEEWEENIRIVQRFAEDYGAQSVAESLLVEDDFIVAHPGQIGRNFISASEIDDINRLINADDEHIISDDGGGSAFEDSDPEPPDILRIDSPSPPRAPSLSDEEVALLHDNLSSPNLSDAEIIIEEEADDMQILLIEQTRDRSVSDTEMIIEEEPDGSLIPDLMGVDSPSFDDVDFEVPHVPSEKPPSLSGSDDQYLDDF